MSGDGTIDNAGLKDWLRDLFHGRGAAAAALRVDLDEQPYEPAARRWQETPEELRPEFVRIVRELVGESAMAPWSPEAFHQLAFFIEAAEVLEVRPAFEKAADHLRRTQSEHRDILLMIALRTLLALGGRATPEFWREQEKFIGSTWPELIFMGLASHDVDDALAQIPRLIKTPKQMQSLLHYFPTLLSEGTSGFDSLRGRCRNLYTQLPAEAAQQMRDWFQLRAQAPKEASALTNTTLRIVLKKYLAQEVDARFRTASLAGSAREAECPAA